MPITVRLESHWKVSENSMLVTLGKDSGLMAISKQNKMMLLFLAPENSLWKLVTGKSRPTQESVLTSCGSISPTNLSNWKRGGVISSEIEEKIFRNAREKVTSMRRDSERQKATELLEIFVEVYHRSPPHIYELAVLLGMSIEQSQLIIDEAVYSRLPLFSKFYGDAVTSHFEHLKGAYHLTMRRNELWLQCAMRIRYVIKIRDGSAIRCKLNVPKIDHEKDGASYWEYDGFLAIHSNHIFWTFEKRDPVRADFIYLVTSLDQISQQRVGFSGTYLTTDQEPEQFIVSDDVFLQRVLSSDVEALEDFMHRSAKVLTSPEEVADAERLWRGFSGRRRVAAN